MSLTIKYAYVNPFQTQNQHEYYLLFAKYC